MWNISFRDDPLNEGSDDNKDLVETTRIVTAECALKNGIVVASDQEAFQEGGRVSRVALADFAARRLSETKLEASSVFRWELLSGPAKSTTKVSSHHGRRHWQCSRRPSSVPYMLERTDIWCSKEMLYIQLRIFIDRSNEAAAMDTSDDESEATAGGAEKATENMLESIFQQMETQSRSALMNHVAVAVLQERLREQLLELKAVAFVANESILPRKSGASNAPMASPPAVPFQAPTNSPMNHTIEISMGKLRSYLLNVPSSPTLTNGQVPSGDDVVSLTGLLVPRGVSLIVGGGYHGKSTLLRCIAAGVYNKIPGDGREFSSTVTDALTVRAEDGRYVNNCNVSAFISNLPTPPGVTKALDTAHFSTGEASGSTSQAANVADAIEMGSSAFLVDEDVSAANFMARDGRMRSLVMDESITPLLYRVNGLYAARGISSIVVVGGVGDWLDVPNAVILMDKYKCRDATAKARSISRQFSHGHVQYGGRGVVHRLPWETKGTPIPRRPSDDFSKLFSAERTAVTLLEGHSAFALIRTGNGDAEELDDEEDDGHFVDMSRCEQLMGKKAQLYGCGICLVWILEASLQFPDLGMADLLKKMDETMDESGFASLLLPKDGKQSQAWSALVELIGCAYRPRRFEVAQALTRLRGIQFEELPFEDDGSAAAEAEAERKKRELLELWNKRRANKLNNNS